MNGSMKVSTSHLNRRGIVYLRQSTTKQVEKNQESAHNQRALKTRLLELGWKPEQVSILEDDQGQSATQTAGRGAFQQMVADVGLGKVGIILGYEVSRLSRNDVDWHRLLELCAIFDTLIGDVDGLYHPRDFNDRLLLGLKGTMSSARLHSLRLRLDAGRLSKAARGELVQNLPTGLVRNLDKAVMLDPDLSIQKRLHLVFDKFVELGTIQKVLTFLAKKNLKIPRRQVSGLYAGEVFWREATAASLGSILHNPAYAGAFAHGRRQVNPTLRIPGRPATGRTRRPQAEWSVLIPGIYPAYISWEQYEDNQRRIAQNNLRIQQRLAAKQAIRNGCALLTGLLRCGKCGRTMGVNYKENRFQYSCNSGYRHYAQRSCQYLGGNKIDEAVTEAFFEVLRPAEIDVLEKLSAERARTHADVVRHLEQDVGRLQYAAHRAEQQYDCVDPKNRLIAASLEEKWESALLAQKQAEENLADARREIPQPIRVPKSLRDAFADVGRQLPELWPELSWEAKKSLLRTMITGVNLHRQSDGLVQIRMVWAGGSVTETSALLRRFSMKHTDLEEHIVERIRQETSEGRSSEMIAADLNREGHHPCRGEQFTSQIVNKLRHRYRIKSPRAKNLPHAWTAAEMAQEIGHNISWMYHKIEQRQIVVSVDPIYRCYLFPKTEEVKDAMLKLKNHETEQITIPRGHNNG